MGYLDCSAAPFRGLSSYGVPSLFSSLPTPCYVIDEARLQANGACLSGLAKRTGCKILLAQKAFSNYNFYPMLSQKPAGCMRLAWAERKWVIGKSMCFAVLIGKKNLLNY